MKTLISIFFVLVSSFIYSNEATQKENIPAQQDTQNSYFYIGLNLSPVIQSFYPGFGYRYQKNYLGFDVNLGANGKNDQYFFADLGINMYIFPKPNPSSQFYLGLGVNQGLTSMKIAYYDSYYYEGRFYDDYYCEWSNSYLLYPTIFVGKDFFLSKGQKIFAEITFIPGLFSTNPSDWDWLTSAGFRLGYGF